MPFQPGTRLSTYEITATLGAGGRGEGKTLMSVPMEKSPTGGLRPGRATPLFQTGIAVGAEIEQYAVSRTGDRFLIPTRVGSSSEAILVLNWYEGSCRCAEARTVAPYL